MRLIFRALPALAAMSVALPGAFPAAAQSAANPTSQANPYYGSVSPRGGQAGAAGGEELPLSLDQAVAMGLENNLGYTVARTQQTAAHGQRLEALQQLIPLVTVSGQTGVHQYNLAALGFKPSLVSEFSSVFPVPPGGISSITKVDVTSGQANLRQTLSLAAFDSYRQAKAGERAAYFNSQSARGETVLTVATTYLQCIAASSRVDNARELLRADAVLLEQARAEHETGVAANLDELRARVQYQTQQQALIAAENQLEKTRILLKREIGLAPERKIVLTDAAPFSDLADMTLEDARAQALKYRQDYQGLEQQQQQAQLGRQAARHERLPSISVSGNYGVTGVSGGPYHGTFVAMGSVNVPVFHEARFRGDRQVAEAQLERVNRQLDDLRGNIDQQLRSDMLDIDSALALVRVARSNVALSTRAVSDETDRFAAGVDDNLPLVQSQATLAAAEDRLVDSLYQYNQAKLTLARHLGVVDTQYRVYLGR